MRRAARRAAFSKLTHYRFLAFLCWGCGSGRDESADAARTAFEARRLEDGNLAGLCNRALAHAQARFDEFDVGAVTPRPR